MVKDLGGNLTNAKSFLNTVYVAWDKDLRTYLNVELMFREIDDPLATLMVDKLEELNRDEGK